MADQSDSRITNGLPLLPPDMASYPTPCLYLILGIDSEGWGEANFIQLLLCKVRNAPYHGLSNALALDWKFVFSQIGIELSTSEGQGLTLYEVLNVTHSIKYNRPKTSRNNISPSVLLQRRLCRERNLKFGPKFCSWGDLLRDFFWNLASGAFLSYQTL